MTGFYLLASVPVVVSFFFFTIFMLTALLNLITNFLGLTEQDFLLSIFTSVIGKKSMKALKKLPLSLCPYDLNASKRIVSKHCSYLN